MSYADSQRVVITGMGVVSGFGAGVAAFWDGMKNGRSAIRELSKLKSFDCKIGGAAPVELEQEGSRVLGLAVSAAVEALEQAGLEGEGLGLSVAMGWRPWDLKTIARGEKQDQRNGSLGEGVEFLKKRFLFNGCVISNVSACAAGTQAIGDAFRAIQLERADVMLVGAADSRLHPQGVMGYGQLNALATGWNGEPERASRPFDKKRSGFVMGEGAGFLVLERLDHARRRGAKIFGEILGAALTTDAYRVTDPRLDGQESGRCMELALKRARLRVEEVDYINAHGTSTMVNDAAEAAALEHVFGERSSEVPVGAMKSMIGHLSMAAGAVETVGTVLALKEQFLPPTINVDDPEFDLDLVPNVGREWYGSVALKNSFGFGGQNACLVLRRWEEG